VLRAALSDAGVSPLDVSYIESHGTGTPLGDPIETGAIAAVYGAGRSEDNPLYVSGVKANIGHLEAASGMAGLLAAVLALQHGQAPPNAQLRKLNEKVAATVEGLPIVFPTIGDSRTLNTAGVLHAGVSSFGYSGTIAHIVLSSAPADARRMWHSPPRVPIIIACFRRRSTSHLLIEMCSRHACIKGSWMIGCKTIRCTARSFCLVSLCWNWLVLLAIACSGPADILKWICRIKKALFVWKGLLSPSL
jgi:acyl transferase domain-containing protein